MKILLELSFDKETDEVLDLYQKAFGCTIKSLIRRGEAVSNGWLEPEEGKDHLVYHSEIMFDEQEVRMHDMADEKSIWLTKETLHQAALDSEEDVVKAFTILSEGGEVISPLEKPPYAVIIGEVRDRFGLKWQLFCDFK